MQETEQSHRYLIAYPFPLDDGQIAKLQLPAGGLFESEAQRLRRFVDSLVTQAGGVYSDDPIVNETATRDEALDAARAGLRDLGIDADR